MRRREFIKLIGGLAATWPLAGQAQQPTLPVVGFVNIASAKDMRHNSSAFLRGLSEAGYVDGRNVVVEFHWAEGRIDRLPAVMADLVHRQVSVIAATSTEVTIAAKAANTTIPIVFETASDPVRLGLVAQLNRPGGNITGITSVNVEIAPKRLQLLHELVPTASVIAVLRGGCTGLARSVSRFAKGAEGGSQQVTQLETPKPPAVAGGFYCKIRKLLPRMLPR
jgi:ABC-type uncharacterized transport system substrate-binding protein